MLIGKFLLFIFYINVSKADKNADELNTLILTMSPQEVLNAVNSLVSSDYMHQLANEFAVKAAEHILSEIKAKKPEDGDLTKREDDKISEPFRLRETKQKTKNPINELLVIQMAQDSKKKPVEKKVERNHEVLDSKEASVLLKAPSADGDNLDRDSNLSVEESKRVASSPPVRTRINGVYYRRLLRLIQKLRSKRS